MGVGGWWQTEFAGTRVLSIKILRVRGSTSRRPLGSDWHLCPPPPPAKQETRHQGSGGCFYGDDLTEGMVRTKPGTIHTYIYYIQRRSPVEGGTEVAPAGETRSTPHSPAHPAPPPPSAEAEEVKCMGPGTETASSFGGRRTSGGRKWVLRNTD